LGCFEFSKLLFFFYFCQLELKGGEVIDSKNYRGIIKSLRYLTCTKPDITLVVGATSRFTEYQRYPHLKAIKKILRYVKGIEDLRLFYRKTNIFKLEGYVDSNRCCDIDDRKSISKYAFFIGGTTFTWLLKKQSTVTLSTYKAEYVAASLGMSPAI
jgi:hypothetical protein